MNWCIKQTNEWTYKYTLDTARSGNMRIHDATSPSNEISPDCAFFISNDWESGFAITPNGGLVGLFSNVNGRGDELVNRAIAEGAKYLDCFDGFLPGFYAKHGFRITAREPNWDPNGPDVVYMSHKTHKLNEELESIGWSD